MIIIQCAVCDDTNIKVNSIDMLLYFTYNIFTKHELKVWLDVQNNFFLKISSTRMHSSRMPTTHFNSHLGAVSASGWGSGGAVCLWVQGLVSASVCRGCLDRHPPGQIPLSRHPPSPLHAGMHTPSCEQNHRQVYKITFPQLCLRAVINLPQNCLYEHTSFQCYDLTRR